jgi:hypothetical protein
MIGFQVFTSKLRGTVPKLEKCQLPVTSNKEICHVKPGRKTDMTGRYSEASQTVTLLSVSPNREESRRLQRIVEHANWTLFCADSFKGAAVILREEAIPVVITEASLPGRKRWQDFIETSTTICPPRVIVTAHLQDDSLWAEVLSEGGYDVLMKPFERSEVVRVAGLAWLNWKEERTKADAGGLPLLYQSGGPRSPLRIPGTDSQGRTA